MQTARIFRLAASAWLLTAIARLVLAVVGMEPTGLEGSPLALGMGAAIGLAVARWLWVRPGRGIAIAATFLGVYAAIGVLYAPVIGPQPWFILLASTGLVAFALSGACWWTSRSAFGRRP